MMGMGVGPGPEHENRRGQQDNGDHAGGALQPFSARRGKTVRRGGGCPKRKKRENQPAGRLERE